MAFYLTVGVWLFSGLMLISMTGLLLIEGMPIWQLGAIMKGTIWRSASTWELAAVPIFLWMGELIFRTDLSERLFRGLEPWVEMVPGRLLHTNIVGCTLFAAVCGSSTATTATIGKITVAALTERNYDGKLAVGSLAGAGSLGLMIPPSIVMIVYGVLAEVSIARLFAAGLFPGLLAAAFYFIYIVVRCWADPSLTPQVERRFTWGDRLRGLMDIAPVAALIPVVLGGIYAGIATPSEAGALGVIATLALAAVTRQLTWRVLVESLEGAVRITCMVVAIIVAAAFMSSAMGYLHVPQEIARAMAALDLGPYSLMVLIFIFYLILGTVLEGLSMLVMSLPITLPLVTAAGFDPIWFGVFLVITVELAAVSPPVGFNLFVLQGLTGQSTAQIAVAATPFVLLLVATAVIITLFPGIALWLPGVLYDL